MRCEELETALLFVRFFFLSWCPTLLPNCAPRVSNRLQSAIDFPTHQITDVSQSLILQTAGNNIKCKQCNDYTNMMSNGGGGEKSFHSCRPEIYSSLYTLSLPPFSLHSLCIQYPEQRHSKSWVHHHSTAHRSTRWASVVQWWVSSKAKKKNNNNKQTTIDVLVTHVRHPSSSYWIVAAAAHRASVSPALPRHWGPTDYRQPRHRQSN